MRKLTVLLALLAAPAAFGAGDSDGIRSAKPQGDGDGKIEKEDLALPETYSAPPGSEKATPGTSEAEAKKRAYQDDLDERLADATTEIRTLRDDAKGRATEGATRALTTAEARRTAADRALARFKKDETKDWESRKGPVEAAFKALDKAVGDAKAAVTAH